MSQLWTGVEDTFLVYYVSHGVNFEACSAIFASHFGLAHDPMALVRRATHIAMKWDLICLEERTWRHDAVREWIRKQPLGPLKQRLRLGPDILCIIQQVCQVLWETYPD